MSKRLTISIVVPVYNEEKYIARCIESLDFQTLKPSEIIVVNDGSTDSSYEVVQKFRSRIKNLRVYKRKHQGPAKARNFGAKKAKGEILVFVDADMYFDKNYLEELVELIERGKAVATFTKEEYVANPKNTWSRCWSINSYLPEDLRIDPDLGEEANNFRAIRRDVFLKTKGYEDLGYGEDVTVLKQLGKVKAKVAGGAKCFHFNPSALTEVFYSARWMGRGDTVKNRFRALAAHSVFNSIMKGMIESIKYKLPEFLAFKLVFDLGFSIGVWERAIKGKKNK